MKNSSLKVLILAVLVITLTFSGMITKQMKDPQKNHYRTFKAGNQIWMTENLKFKVSGGCYWVGNDSILNAEMGMLYTWEAAIKADELIKGWRLPTKEDFQKLRDRYGNSDSVVYTNIVADSLNFPIIYSGARLSSGKYVAKGIVGNYWSSTPSAKDSTLSWSIAFMNNLKIISGHNYPKRNACSVRLIKDRRSGMY
jgi:uncharacterized protein (TIGR02145 family)